MRSLVILTTDEEHGSCWVVAVRVRRMVDLDIPKVIMEHIIAHLQPVGGQKSLNPHPQMVQSHETAGMQSSDHSTYHMALSCAESNLLRRPGC